MYGIVKFYILLISLLLLTQFSLAQEPAISLTLSQVSCISPCAIHFDATDTTSQTTSFPFHELYYEWNFGNPQSRFNTATGAAVAHTYEISPGQGNEDFIITLTVRDTNGLSTSLQRTVTIIDPETIFTGENTICFAKDTNDWSGCPNGARRVTTTDTSLPQEIMNNAESNRRLLLRRGDTWTTTQTIPIYEDGPAQLGAFGNCNNPDERGICENAPLIRYGRNGAAIHMLRTSGLTHWTVMDIAIDGMSTGDNSQKGIELENHALHNLFLRIKAFHLTEGIIAYGTGGTYTLHNFSIIQDSDLFDTVGNGKLVTHGGHGIAMIGTRAWNSTLGLNSVRVVYADRGYFSHNIYGPQRTISNTLKFHAPHWEHGYELISQYNVLTDNEFVNSDMDGASWSIGLGAEDNTPETDTRVANILFERNMLRAGEVVGIGAQRLLHITARNVTVRNNIFDLSGSLNHFGIEVVDRYGGEPRAENIFIYGNTFYSQDVGEANRRVVGIRTQINTGTPIENLIIRNNLLYAPNAIGSVNVIEDRDNDIPESDFQMIHSNNLVALSNPFITSNPDFLSDFALNEDTYTLQNIIDQGFSLPQTFSDFIKTTRPQGQGFDIGAFELRSNNPPICGNAALENGEECDDGNQINGDGCDANCRSEQTCLHEADTNCNGEIDIAEVLEVITSWKNNEVDLSVVLEVIALWKSAT